jgi:hypothetical protein
MVGCRARLLPAGSRLVGWSMARSHELSRAFAVRFGPLPGCSERCQWRGNSVDRLHCRLLRSLDLGLLIAQAFEAFK